MDSFYSVELCVVSTQVTVYSMLCKMYVLQCRLLAVYNTYAGHNNCFYIKYVITYHLITIPSVIKSLLHGHLSEVLTHWFMACSLFAFLEF